MAAESFEGEAQGPRVTTSLARVCLECPPRFFHLVQESGQPCFREPRLLLGDGEGLPGAIGGSLESPQTLMILSGGVTSSMTAWRRLDGRRGCLTLTEGTGIVAARGP